MTLFPVLIQLGDTDTQSDMWAKRPRTADKVSSRVSREVYDSLLKPWETIEEIIV